MKRIFCLLGLCLTLLASAQETPDKVRPVCGPYVQNPTTTGFTVVWETNMDAIAWVEVAPDDGTHFYNEDRTKYYDMRGFGNQVIRRAAAGDHLPLPHNDEGRERVQGPGRCDLHKGLGE